MYTPSWEQTPSVTFPNTHLPWRLQSRGQSALQSSCAGCKHTQSQTASPKSYNGEPTRLHHHYRLPSERRNWLWESKMMTERGRGKRKKSDYKWKIRKKSPLHSSTVKIPRLHVEKCSFAVPVLYCKQKFLLSSWPAKGGARVKGHLGNIHK